MIGLGLERISVQDAILKATYSAATSQSLMKLQGLKQEYSTMFHNEFCIFATVLVSISDT